MGGNNCEEKLTQINHEYLNIFGFNLVVKKYETVSDSCDSNKRGEGLVRVLADMFYLFSVSKMAPSKEREGGGGEETLKQKSRIFYSFLTPRVSFSRFSDLRERGWFSQSPY